MSRTEAEIAYAARHIAAVADRVPVIGQALGSAIRGADERFDPDGVSALKKLAGEAFENPALSVDDAYKSACDLFGGSPPADF